MRLHMRSIIAGGLFAGAVLAPPQTAQSQAAPPQVAQERLPAASDR